MTDRDRIQVEFYDAFPLCFPQGAPRCGFYVGDGWLPLIKQLCIDITVELEKLPKEERIKFQVSQVKEKFGSLRFYADAVFYGPINDLISKAEKDSESICEICGAPGKIKSGGWLKALCDSCDTKR